jgi:hypothetical protein
MSGRRLPTFERCVLPPSSGRFMVFIIASMRATYSTNLILLDFVTLISVEEYKVWCSSLRNLLNYTK